MRATKSTQGLSRARLLRFQWEDRALHGTMGHDPQGSGTKYRWWAAANVVRHHAATRSDGMPRVDRDGLPDGGSVESESGVLARCTSP